MLHKPVGSSERLSTGAFNHKFRLCKSALYVPFVLCRMVPSAMKTLYSRDFRPEVLQEPVHVVGQFGWPPLQVLRLAELQHDVRLVDVCCVPESVLKKPLPAMPVVPPSRSSRTLKSRAGTPTLAAAAPATPRVIEPSVYTPYIATIVNISAGLGGHCVFVAGKRVFSFGLADSGQLGIDHIPAGRPSATKTSASRDDAVTSSFKFVNSPALIERFVGTGVIQACAGHHHSIAVTVSGEVYSWYVNHRGTGTLAFVSISIT
jgi:hypothetical protein